MKLFISILIPNIIGFLGGILGGSFSKTQEFIMPSFVPPGFVFPIVWTILYILMGISFYIVNNSNDMLTKKSNIIYFVQLFLNSLWTIIFFKFKLFLIAYIWILVIMILVVYLMSLYFKINKLACYLQIPYLLWLLFASILTLITFVIN